MSIEGILLSFPWTFLIIGRSFALLPSILSDSWTFKMYYLFFCKAINDASIVKLLGTKIDLKTMLGLYLVVENLENSLFNPVVH